MEISARFAIPQQLHVGALVFEQGGVTILASPQEAHPRCPECGYPARRVHSRYSRTIADLPWGGVPAYFRVHIRKLYAVQSFLSPANSFSLSRALWRATYSAPGVDRAGQRWGKVSAAVHDHAVQLQPTGHEPQLVG